MELRRFVDEINRHLGTIAATGDEQAQATVQRVIAPLETALRLVLLEALSAAAAEITGEMAPGSVELRLRAGEPEFVVNPPQAGSSPVTEAPVAPSPGLDTEGGMARINLRLPETLKTRVEDAAEREGLSINAWLVRAAAAAADRSTAPTPHPHRPAGSQRYTGWAQ
ncbi:toxin-antitoxin system HicB family antitoxin [Skermania sp. ID1734]|uniref:toxin-antitoxin system HicB family antitoxin n=1 Tax=Skermania sp. ID1734 TaxID=2597516 RepID=UPI00117D3DDF|nr:toxin-antitoxin system HicB family antitoxin [Skermania sp. ID1734]TSE01540.1 toxin-antitoxin system HicB family antitoxin [Skermania sp. ID1734]